MDRMVLDFPFSILESGLWILDSEVWVSRSMALRGMMFYACAARTLNLDIIKFVLIPTLKFIFFVFLSTLLGELLTTPCVFGIGTLLIIPLLPLKGGVAQVVHICRLFAMRELCKIVRS